MARNKISYSFQSVEGVWHQGAVLRLVANRAAELAHNYAQAQANFTKQVIRYREFGDYGREWIIVEPETFGGFDTQEDADEFDRFEQVRREWSGQTL